MLNSGLIVSTTERNPTQYTLPSVPLFIKFSSLAGGNKHYSGADVSSRAVAASGGFRTHMPVRALLGVLWLSGALRAALASPVLCAGNYSRLALPGPSAPSSPLKGSASHCCSLKTLSRQRARAAEGLASFAAHLSEITVLCHLMCSVLEMIISYILSGFICCCCSRWWWKSGPCYYILVRVRSLLRCPANTQMEILKGWLDTLEFKDRVEAGVLQEFFSGVVGIKACLMQLQEKTGGKQLWTASLKMLSRNFAVMDSREMGWSEGDMRVSQQSSHKGGGFVVYL